MALPGAALSLKTACSGVVSGVQADLFVFLRQGMSVLKPQPSTYSLSSLFGMCLSACGEHAQLAA